jgi:hypothetical protein
MRTWSAAPWRGVDVPPAEARLARDVPHVLRAAPAAAAAADAGEDVPDERPGCLMRSVRRSTSPTMCEHMCDFAPHHF